MKTLIMNNSQEEILRELLEVEIETTLDVHESKEGIEREFLWNHFDTIVRLYSQLDGKFETKLLKESYEIVYNEPFEG